MAIEGPIGPARRGSWLVSLRKSYLDWLVRKVESGFDSTIGFWDGHAKAVVDLGDRQSLEVVVIGGDAAYRERDASAANGLLRARSGSTLAAMRWQHRVRTGPAEPSRLFPRDRVPEHGRQRAGAGARLHAGDWLARRRDDAGSRPVARRGGRRDRARARRISLRAGSGSRTAGDLRVRATGPSVFGRSRQRRGSRAADRRRSRRITVGRSCARARSDIDGISWSPWLAADRRAGRLTFRVAAGGSAQLPDPLTVLAANETTTGGARRIDRRGISHEVTPGMTWSVDAFVRREWNVLRSVDERVDPMTDERVFSPPFPVALATLEGRARGVDVVVRRHAPARLAGWVGYTWARARVRDRATGERFDADFDQRHTAESRADAAAYPIAPPSG